MWHQEKSPNQSDCFNYSISDSEISDAIELISKKKQKLKGSSIETYFYLYQKYFGPIGAEAFFQLLHLIFDKYFIWRQAFVVLGQLLLIILLWTIIYIYKGTPLNYP